MKDIVIYCGIESSKILREIFSEESLRQINSGTKKENLQRVQHPSIHFLKGEVQNVFPTFSKANGEATYKTETLQNNQTNRKK